MVLEKTLVKIREKIKNGKDKNNKEINPGYDLKEEFTELQKEIYNKESSKNPIVQFITFKLFNYKKLKIECDKPDDTQISGEIYKVLWLEKNPDALQFVDGEIMNSFWTIFRKTLELSFNEYYIKIKPKMNEKSNALKYEFALLFGGIAQNMQPICGLNKEHGTS